MGAGSSSFGTVIIGGGPAATAVLLAACRTQRLEALLDAGVAIIEASSSIGDGEIGRYVIQSDSTADTFIDCLRESHHEELRALLDHPVIRAVSDLRECSAPLPAVARLQRLVGVVLWRIVAAHPDCAVYTGHVAVAARRQPDGAWQVTFNRRSGARRYVSARHLVLATGAHQPPERLEAETVAGVWIVPRFGEKLMQSGEILAKAGMARLHRRLAGQQHPKIAIIGGSTSAVAVAQLLLTRLPDGVLTEGALTLLHRRELRIYYTAPALARAEGYDEFGPDDICPVSGRVFRLAGLRLESRELIMRARGIGGRPPEPRLHLHRLSEPDPAALDILERADVVIAALGYRPRALKLFSVTGQPMALHAHGGPNAPLVDGQCCVLDDQQRPIDGVFAIGLAAGFVPHGPLGGEPSFRGQANGLWLWQTGVGGLIVDALLSGRANHMDHVQPQPYAALHRPALPMQAAAPPAGHGLRIALMRPAPAPLSSAVQSLRQIEASGIFSNFGPMNTAFEREIIQTLFDGNGHCTTVCNATLGLMLALRDAIEHRPAASRRYALMPSFTFAAAAHAAMWCGLVPLFCDIDPHNWAADPRAEEELLKQYGAEIAVVVPYATFGYDIDLARYKSLSARHQVPVVVDAAASLGTKSRRGQGFGTGAPMPLVFSMHATKTFATGEGGLIYSADKALIARLRQMSNFGFGAPRCATMPGLNAKMSEVGALQGRLRLQGYDRLVARRHRIACAYRQALPELTFQAFSKVPQAHQFAAALLPPGLGALRDEIQASMTRQGIGTGHYFSPHLAEQVYFGDRSLAGPLDVTQDIAARMISLPMFDGMSDLDTLEVVAALKISLRKAGALAPGHLAVIATPAASLPVTQ